MEDDLLRNADEFLASGEENLARRRYNAAVSDFWVSALFRTYTRSYNLRSTKEEAAMVKAYAIELRSAAAAKGH